MKVTVSLSSVLRDAVGAERLEVDLGGEGPATVGRALEALSRLDLAPKTLAEYRGAASAFCGWLVRTRKLLPANPVDSLPAIRTRGDIRKRRRALTPDEAVRLLATVARRSSYRALWYETALFTGLRVGELQALEWRDLRLDGPSPCIALRAETTKAARADVVPLRRDLATKLRAHRPANAMPTARVFPTTPTRATFRADCERAGIRWQADEDGRTLDRHALRTTFVSWLSAAGVSPRTAQALARHTDIRLTMANYTDPRLLDARGAVERLPDLDTPDAGESRATGTDDVRGEVVAVSVVPDVVLTGRDTRETAMTGSAPESSQRPVLSGVGNKRQELSNTRENGGGRIRTADLGVMNPSL